MVAMNVHGTSHMHGAESRMLDQLPTELPCPVGTREDRLYGPAHGRNWAMVLMNQVIK